MVSQPEKSAKPASLAQCKQDRLWHAVAVRERPL
jgi:hypothetical protein